MYNEDIIKLNPELNTLLKNEDLLLMVKSDRRHPLKAFLPQLIISSIFSIIFFLLFYLFAIERIHEYNFDMVVIKTKNSIMDYLLDPTLFITVAFGVCLIFLTYSIIKLSKKGDYFIFTNNSLIRYNDNSMQQYDWNSFTGNFKLDKRLFNKKDIYLELKTGNTAFTKDSKSYLVPDEIYIAHVIDANKVLQILKEKIKTT